MYFNWVDDRDESGWERNPIESEHRYMQYIPVQKEMLVAVVDGGIDYTATVLKDKIYYNSNEIPNNGIDDDNNGLVDDYMGYDFGGYTAVNGGDNDPFPGVGDFHGTFIAGIIAAKKNDLKNHIGINPDCKLLNVKCFDGCLADIAVSIRYAVDMGAKIVNCSIGVFDSTHVIIDALDYAYDNHAIIVAAAGNMGQEIIENYLPAYDVRSITVGGYEGVKEQGYWKDQYSNYGPQVDFAESQVVYSLKYEDKYEQRAGTSYSCAIVSGIISRVWGNDPSMSRDEVINKLISHTEKLKSAHSDEMGYGRIKSDELAKTLVSVDKRYVKLNIPGQICHLELDIVRQPDGVIRRYLEYLHYNGKRYPIHKEV